jgi:hypothetical protein
MATLGSFGAAVREYEQDSDRDTFDFFGEEFTVTSVVPPIVLLKCCAGMAGELNGVQADAAMYEALRYALIVPGDRPDRSEWERFYALAADRKASGDSLASLVLNIMGAQAGKDLEPLPGSPDGSPTASTNSNSSSSDTPDSSHMIPVDEFLGGSMG